MKVFRLGAALCGLVLASAAPADEVNDAVLDADLSKRFSIKALSACHALLKTKKVSSSSDTVLLPFTPNSGHYLSSSSDASSCVYSPHTPEDLAAALKIIAKRRTQFAVSCSGHTGNPDFSSTGGIHISMHGFQDVTVAGDNSYVDIGGGISWADAYKKLDSSTVHVVGGRVPGPGIGGFVTGGGGYSWLTNQYGLTGDTLISVNLVLPNGTLSEASETTNSDLFWAIKGGGNQFGVIYNFRLKAFPRPAKIYGGMKIYPGEAKQSFLDAISDFAANNKDPKAQVIPTINTVLGVPVNVLIAYYDGVPERDPFHMFNETFKTQSFNSFVQSLASSELVNNQRGGFNTLSLQKVTPAIMAQIKNQTNHWSKQALVNSGSFISFDIEPFLPYSQHAKDAAWTHDQDAQPLFVFMTWLDPLKDKFWRNALLESCKVFAETAKQDGQDIDNLYLYPNYAASEEPSKKLYGADNLARLRELKQKYDADGVMSLTTFFKF